MEPYERSELGGIGEGSGVLDGAQPLTQSRVGSKLSTLQYPLPLERGIRSMPKMAHAGEYHRQACFVSGSDDFFVAHRSSGLDDCRCAGFCGSK